MQRPLGERRYLLTPTLDNADEFVMNWDYSGASTYMRCPRAAENYHVQGREMAKDQSALSFGRLFHKLAEVKDKEGLTDTTQNFMKERIAQHFMEFPCSPTDHRNSDMMFSVNKLYNERWKNDGWKEKTFVYEGEPFIERPFKIEFCSIPVNSLIPYPSRLLTKTGNDRQLFIGKLHVHYVGRIDLVLEEAGNLWVVDRKTTSRGGSEFEEAFRLSLQTRGYAWVLWKITGRRPMGCILDAAVVRKPTKTGKGTELDRKNYFYTEESLIEFEGCMQAHVADFIGCLVRGYFPQSAQSFKSPCAGCDYADNCALPLGQRAADLASDIYRNVTWNPLTEQ